MSVDLKIDWCSHKAAKYAVEHWHYSKCLPIGKLIKIGVWENSKYKGVVIFGRGASPNLGKKFSLEQDQCVELVRVALKAHITAVSKIISIAIKYLSKTNSGIRLIISFADRNQGHIGIIYQAGNWVFCGESPKTTELYIKGKWIHWRGGFYSKTESTPRRIMPGKYRYLMPLDKAMRKQIEPLRKPYPKRGLIEEQQTPSAYGGASPTSTLQT